MPPSDPPLAWTVDDDHRALAAELRRRFPRDRETPYRSPPHQAYEQPRVIVDGAAYPQRLWWLEEP